MPESCGLVVQRLRRRSHTAKTAGSNPAEPTVDRGASPLTRTSEAITGRHSAGVGVPEASNQERADVPLRLGSCMTPEVDLSQVRTRAGLSDFVSRNPESATLEYK